MKTLMYYLFGACLGCLLVLPKDSIRSEKTDIRNKLPDTKIYIPPFEPSQEFIQKENNFEQKIHKVEANVIYLENIKLEEEVSESYDPINYSR